MTGIFVRIQRDNGDWQNVEIDQLTDNEIDRFIEEKKNSEPKQDGWNWVGILAIWIRNHVRDVK